MARLRHRVGGVLGLSPSDAEAHHPASQWRYNLIDTLVKQSEDPDTSLADLAKNGAPLGIESPIPVGGLFPEQVPERDMTLDNMVAQRTTKSPCRPMAA